MEAITMCQKCISHYVSVCALRFDLSKENLMWSASECKWYTWVGKPTAFMQYTLDSNKKYGSLIEWVWTNWTFIFDIDTPDIKMQIMSSSFKFSFYFLTLARSASSLASIFHSIGWKWIGTIERLKWEIEPHSTICGLIWCGGIFFVQENTHTHTSPNWWGWVFISGISKQYHTNERKKPSLHIPIALRDGKNRFRCICRLSWPYYDIDILVGVGA